MRPLYPPINAFLALFWQHCLCRPARFDLDPTMLDRRYKDAQRLIHPDKFHNKSEAEQAHSSAFASHLASANKTLKEPLSRAQYLVCAPLDSFSSRFHQLQPHLRLFMVGFVLCSRFSFSQLRTVGISVGEEGDTCSDPAFLMEMMELRETVDDLLQTLSANKADTPAAAADLARARVELKQCASQLQEHANGIHNELITAFHNGNSSLDIRSAAHPAPDTATARALVTRLLYLERVRAAILDRV